MKDRKILIVNLFAGPGAGKSTIAAQIFSELKWKGVNCELVTEYAKELVYENDLEKLKDQRAVYEEQKRRIERLKNKVDVIITDSPILLSLVYGTNISKSFIDEIIKYHNNLGSINFFLKREKRYSNEGRLQNEEEVFILDQRIISMLDMFKISYFNVKATKFNTYLTVKKLLDILKEIY